MTRRSKRDPARWIRRFAGSGYRRGVDLPLPRDGDPDVERVRALVESRLLGEPSPGPKKPEVTPPPALAEPAKPGAKSKPAK